MIHFDEMACLLYLEGQLDAARSRELAAHVEECASCRDLLHALEHETTLLSSALTEDNEPMPARLLSEQGRSMPSWVWTLAFGVFAAGAYWFWTDGIGALVRPIEQCRLRRHGCIQHDCVQRSFLGRME